MRSLLAVMVVLAVSVPLAAPSAADAAIRAKKVKTNDKGRGRPVGDVVKRGKPSSHRGLSGIFKARQPGKKSAVRQKLGRAVTKVRKGVTFDRVIRTQIGLMRFGSTITLGAALTTGRPSVIVMAGVMTAAAYALGPAMRLAERIGERIGERIVARADQRGG